MPKFFGHCHVMVHVLRAAAVLNDPMHEYQSHAENRRGLTFDKFEEPPHARLVRVLLGKMPTDPSHDACIVLWSRGQIEDLLLRLLVWEPQFQRLRAIKFCYVRLIEDEQGDRA